MICKKCNKDKDLSEFYKNKDGKINKYTCTDCISEYNRKYHKEYFKEYYIKNKEKHNNKNKEWYIKNKNYYIKNKEKIRKQKIEYINKNVHKVWARSSINDHKKKKYNVIITVDELTNLAKNTLNCPICGIKFRWEYGRGNTMNSPTLDRINNEDSITKENCHIICKRCNITKLDRTLEEMDNWIQQWNKYRNQT